MTLRHWLLERAERTPESAALVCSGRQWSYRELADVALRRARELRRAGVRDGDCVAVWLPNSFAAVVLFYTVSLCGARFLPLHPRAVAAEVVSPLRTASAAFLIADSERVAPAAEVVRDLTHVRCGLAQPDGSVEWHGEACSGVDVPLCERINLSSTLAILLTSGTTGEAKAARLSYANFLWSAVASAFHMGALPSDRWLLCLSLCHVGGLSILVRSLLAGGAVILHERFNAEAVNEIIDRDGVTLLSCVPTMLHRLLAVRGERAAPTSLRAVLLGGAPAPPTLLAAARDLRFPVLSSYGLTETTSQIATAPFERRYDRHAAALAPLFGAEVRVVDAQGRKLPRGGEGEIWVRGPMLMQGYACAESGAIDTARAETVEAGDATETDATVMAGEAAGLGDDGWFATGDWGTLDAAGFLRVCDRREDRILSGGENVSPVEVEAVLAEHPGVRDVAVAGLPDIEWGRRVAAWIVCAGSTPLAVEELDRHCRSRLAAFKRPREYRFVLELPRTRSGKLRRNTLPELEPGVS